jgi:hypothetical protein
VLFFEEIYFHSEKIPFENQNYWSLALNLKTILGVHINEKKINPPSIVILNVKNFLPKEPLLTQNW